MIAFGTCGGDVKKLQSKLNEVMGAKNVVEDGVFGEGTEFAVKVVQEELGLSATGKADGKTLKAINWALMPRTKVTVNGRTAYVTEPELMALKARASAARVKALRPYVAKAKLAKGHWEFHKKLQDDNWFSGIVDWYAGADFPPKKLIDDAEAAAHGMIADAVAGKEIDVKARAKPIEAALTRIQTYMDTLHEGGEDLVSDLKTIRDGCVVTLEVTAAVATGGASWGVQVGTAAGIGAYKGVVRELDKAAKGKDISVKSVTVGAFKGGAVDGSVGLIMKGGGKGVGNFMDDAAETAIKKVGTGGARKAVKAYAIRGVNGGGKKVIEDGLKGIPGIADPKKKWTRENFVDKAAESFVQGFGLSVIGPVADDYGSVASKKFTSKEIFRGLGKVDPKKAYSEGVKKAVDIAGKEAVDRVLKRWDPKKPHKSFEAEVKKEILKDRRVKQAARKAAAGGG